MILTKELFEKGRSSKGAFSSKQVKLLGLDFKDLWKGWQNDVIGENYKFETIQKFIDLKDKHLKLDSNFDKFWANKATKKKKRHSYSKENIKTINEAKNNLLTGLKKIYLND